MIFNTYPVIVDGHHGEGFALDYAAGMVWSELEAEPCNIAYHEHIDTIDGIGVFYDYGADYYFFTDETEV